MPSTVAPPAQGPPPRPVPVRHVLGIIGLVLAAAAAVQLVMHLQRIISWLLIAGFFAVVLTPPVNFLVRRLHLPRSLAALIVFVLGVIVFGAMIYSFVRPLVDEANHFINNLPTYVEDARAGRGTAGELVKRYDLDERVERNRDNLRDAARQAGRPALKIARSVIPTIAVAFLHSTTAGIIITVVFIVYQQFENHVLQVTIMAKTVKLNPLTVLVSVLAGVELYGFLGALLAIPAAGVLQVVFRDIFDARRGRVRPEPTVGVDQVPISKVPPSTIAGEEPHAREAS